MEFQIVGAAALKAMEPSALCGFAKRPVHLSIETWRFDRVGGGMPGRKECQSAAAL
jgi:hypothetical protein